MSDGESDVEWVAYSDRPDWSDVKPLKQESIKDQDVVTIAYSDKFVDVYNYFRAIYASGEISERALNLTADAIELNPANYTAWHQRRVILKGLSKMEQHKSILRKELDYIRDVIESNQKNYQVWQHRRVIVEWLKDSSYEMRFCEIVLSQDAKNYHAWQHRQWAIQAFDLYDGELEFIEGLLEDDIRNNSAWNQRFLLTIHDSNPTIKGPVLEREIHYTMKAITKVPGNESAWNYLRGLIDNCDESESVSLREKCYSFCETLFVEQGRRSSYLLAAIVDLIIEKIENRESQDKAKDIEKAKELCHLLATEHDTIRREYWNFMQRDIEKKCS